MLARITAADALLRHLDALAWESFQPDRELEDESSPGPPSPHTARAAADAARAFPSAMVAQMRGQPLPAGAVRGPAGPAGKAGWARLSGGGDDAMLLSTEALGLLLAWRLALDLRARSSSRLQGNMAGFVRQQALLPTLLNVAFAHVALGLPAVDGPMPIARCGSLEQMPDAGLLCDEDCGADAMERLGGHLFLCAVQALPALARQWYNGLDRVTATRVERMTAASVTPVLLGREVAAVQESSGEHEELGIRASVAAREITASYVKDEAVLEMVLRVPAAYPLRPVEVDGTKRLGVGEATWRKWLLGMRTLLDNRDGSLVDAVLLWKRNIDKVFEGVEECPICYTVIHLVNGTLPKLPCHTCRHRFHSACLFKWFQTANKSACPLCQTPWYS
jgi:E3 ubiquitin-protein ligase listerin